MIYCSAQHVRVAFYKEPLFEDVSLEIHHRDRVALIGPNGCGKSTLLRVLTGERKPDGGTVAVKRGIEIGYLQQLPAYDADLTVWQRLKRAFADIGEIERQMERVEAQMADPAAESGELDRLLAKYATLQQRYEEAGGYQVDAKIRSTAGGLGIAEAMLDTACVSLSGGERSKVELAALLMREPDLLLLDEPTNHLDLDAIEWLETFLANYRGALLVVSHDRQFLNRVATKVFDLDAGKLEVYHGNYTSAMRQREARLLAEFHAYQEQQKKLEQMRKAIKRLREWANRAHPPNAGLHRRATNMQRAMDRIAKLDRPVLERARMAARFEVGERSGQDVVTMHGVGKRFGERIVLMDVHLRVRWGNRVGIVGHNGAGKSTVLKLMIGELQPDEGEVRLGSSVRAGYLSQQALDEPLRTSVIGMFRSEVAVSEEQARNILAKFLFYGEDVFKSYASLSGGERMRLRMAQLMQQDVNLLLLDEPTNHLDIDSREALEDALDDYDGTLVVVSHDRHFLNRVCNVTVWLEDGLATTYLGGYDEARSKRIAPGH